MSAGKSRLFLSLPFLFRLFCFAFFVIVILDFCAFCFIVSQVMSSFDVLLVSLTNTFCTVNPFFSRKLSLAWLTLCPNTGDSDVSWDTLYLSTARTVLMPTSVSTTHAWTEVSVRTWIEERDSIAVVQTAFLARLAMPSNKKKSCDWVLLLSWPFSFVLLTFSVSITN